MTEAREISASTVLYEKTEKTVKIGPGVAMAYAAIAVVGFMKSHRNKFGSNNGVFFTFSQEGGHRRQEVYIYQTPTMLVVKLDRGSALLKEGE